MLGDRCDLREVVLERAAFWSALAEDQHRPWQVVLPPGAHPLAVSAADAEVAIDALLGNVFAHTPEGTAVRVALERGSEGTVRFVVDDAGPGFDDPDEALAREASGVGSTGLGLDIARRIAEGAGGSIHLGRTSLGGARVELRFPPASASA